MRDRIEPGPGQESVWDYPRPPKVEPSPLRARVALGGVVIADSTSTRRVLETSHPPVHYFPPGDVAPGVLREVERSSFCEWKGSATYFDVHGGDAAAPAAAWTYRAPTPRFGGLRGYVAFYPGRMEWCELDGERVVAQPGDFYGGWVTSRVVGPFKGSAGTWGW